MKTDVSIKHKAELVKTQKFEGHFGNCFTAHGRATTCQDIAGMQTRQTLQR
jgi:hypothetical protein